MDLTRLRIRSHHVVLVLALAVLPFIRIAVTYPRIHVRWDASLSASARAQHEQTFTLRNGIAVDEASQTWRYELRDLSEANVRELLSHPAVRDTAYIDRSALAAEEGRSVAVRLVNPFAVLFATSARTLHVVRSLCCVLLGVLLLRSAGTSQAWRRTTVLAALGAFGILALAFPIDPGLVPMGGSADHIATRADFESWFGGRVRFEKHLSQVALWQTYLRLPSSESAPEQALGIVTRAAVLLFVATAVVVGAVEKWSDAVVRYLGLVVLAPSALLYFGWRELGYLSLSAAAFPLLARGLRDGGPHLEAGSAFSGLGAALHGSGLVSLAGSWLAAAGTTGTINQRANRTLTVLAWGTAAYLGWAAVYVILLKLSIQPDPGAAEFNPWRPWMADEIRAGRVAAALFSPTGLRDVLVSAWVVGLPLGVVAASLRRQFPCDLRAALWYALPSLAFLVFRWPFDGIGQGLDLVFAGFPALYAFAWVCAQQRRQTMVAACLLISAHYAFWWTIFDQRFQT